MDGMTIGELRSVLEQNAPKVAAAAAIWIEIDQLPT